MDKTLTYIERQKPLWLRISAAILFTIVAGLIFHFVITMDFSLEERHFYGHFDYFQTIFILLFLAIYFSYTVNCYFDFGTKLFKREKTIGIFRYGRWKPLPDLDYVSLFAVNANTFEINLWHSKNKHWDLYEKYDFKDAFTIAYELSELLDISLLDATIPGDFKWVDKKATMESGNMVYVN
ncbi:hypothetical protein FPF71_00075 [Algibacter amylolyticus]|uniref:Uncharacterized protein n=1 Tax=Algibacter amylolyticus TaxID=1608400 RepID=A0A5M7BFH7_9FLAO|nr:hypothetical protein [Algibacter amylolyticus]KAA5827277.1 hypothetical protein F2B50_00075 [Algibacter amylolyticus]MBB5266458.1 hypothetical protein [Algibacter amylolyticus]TSJ81522.1 hypothetical protein FPF71_00075 [Algibacter amylolyticus]